MNNQAMIIVIIMIHYQAHLFAHYDYTDSNFMIIIIHFMRISV